MYIMFLLNVWTFDIYLKHVMKILCKNSCVFENKHFSFFHFPTWRSVFRFFRRLKALETMMQQSYYTQWSVELILQATELQCKEALEALNITLENTLGDVRQGLLFSF